MALYTQVWKGSRRRGAAGPYVRSEGHVRGKNETNHVLVIFRISGLQRRESELDKTVRLRSLLFLLREGSFHF